MVILIKQKYAYTLMEACIVMLILSIFVAVTANVIPHKVKPKNQSDTHGRYECYYIGNDLYEKTCFKENCLAPKKVTACRFTAPKYIKFLIINAVGGSAPNGGSAGEFVSTFYSSSNATYEMQPGKFGSAGHNGGSSDIFECSNTNCSSKTLIMSAAGGSNTAGASGYLNTTTDDIEACTIEVGPKITKDSALSKGYICAKGPTCEIENNRLKVSYCRTNELYKTAYLPYSKATTINTQDYRNNQFIVDSDYTSWNSSTRTLTYYDTSLWDDYGTSISSGWNPTTDVLTPSLYKLTLIIKTGSNSEVSLMDNYVEMLQLPTDGGIRSVHPGSIVGGIPKSGGILLLW